MADAATTRDSAGAKAGGAKAAGRAKRAPAPAKVGGIDYATLLGVIGGFAVIISAMVLGGSPGSFVDVPAVLIVIGGTFLVTTVSFTLGEVIRAQRVMLKAVTYQTRAPTAAAKQVLYLADVARKQGPLALQKLPREQMGESFLRRAVNLVIDGTPGDEVERIMSREAEATADRHIRSAGILRRAGEVAPAMGLIGTLVGLVQMLGNLEDPSSIGPAMAVALLTTFYGAILANMVFLPIANKLERNATVEAMVNHIYVQGAASIGRQENPRKLEIVLNTILSPAERVNFFD
jgi:chemotaxis protein MotA